MPEVPNLQPGQLADSWNLKAGLFVCQTGHAEPYTTSLLTLSTFVLDRPDTVAVQDFTLPYPFSLSSSATRLLFAEGLMGCDFGECEHDPRVSYNRVLPAFLRSLAK